MLQGIKPINNINPINYLSVASKSLQPNITACFLTKQGQKVVHKNVS